MKFKGEWGKKIRIFFMRIPEKLNGEPAAAIGYYGASSSSSAETVILELKLR